MATVSLIVHRPGWRPEVVLIPFLTVVLSQSVGGGIIKIIHRKFHDSNLHFYYNLEN